MTQGGFVRGRDLAPATLQPLRIDADVVVVGTGAGGSVMLRALARAGLNAVALEQGPLLGPRDFNQREDDMIPRLYQDAGGRSTEDMAVRVLQGRGVGGSTIHNTNLCKRTPDAVLELWARRHHVEDAGPERMSAAFDAIERELGVAEIAPALRNGNNEILRSGCETLGWRGGPLRHNRIGCVQSGFCELGCAYDAKQNALKVLLPQAVASGARIYSDVDVTRIEHDGGRVRGVRGFVRRDTGERRAGGGEVLGEIEVRARVVVLAGSAVGSAALARASGIPDPHGTLGGGLRLHPGGVVAGRFDREIAAWRGIPQSYECTEHLSFEEGSDRRVWIVTAFAHPIGAAAALPGFGAAHMAAMRSYPKLAVLTAMVHDESRGDVVVERDAAGARGSGFRPVLRYAMNERDQRQLARGLVACARLLLAAGAREITIPAIPPQRAKTLRDLDAIDLSVLRPHSVPLTAVHPMGTMCMGEDPASSVVRSTGEHHHVSGLFVCDGSLFPTSLGVPPQISIYAFALHLSPHAIERARG